MQVRLQELPRRDWKLVPLMWDAITNEVLFGVTSLTHVDRLVSLFQQTFGYGLEPVLAGKRAFELATVRSQAVDDSRSSAFIPGVSAGDVAWIPDDTSRDFLGNEFLLWLWWYTDNVSDTVEASGGRAVTFMLARSMTLACPRGETGTNTIKNEGPSRLPEAKRAVKSGKLPRKVGLTLVHDGEQFEFMLHADTLGVGSAKLSRPADDIPQARAKLEDRVRAIRAMNDSILLLFAHFVEERVGKGWIDTLPKMQKWLAEIHN